MSEHSRPIGTDTLEIARAALVPKSRKAPTRTGACRAFACGASTSENKPFCFDHLLLHPYARAVQETLRRREELGPRDVEHERRQRMRERRQAKVTRDV